MSIIERVAELLGPIEKARVERLPGERADDESSSRLRPDQIERAITELSEAPVTVESGALAEFVAQSEVAQQTSESEVAATPTGYTTKGAPAEVRSERVLPTNKIDWRLLRRQGLVQPDGARTPVAECIRLIKSQLLMNVGNPVQGARGNLIMVTSALPAEGKTFCAINIAISIALERDRSVLLVDGDVAYPSIPQRLGLNADQGLMDVLDGRIGLSDALCKTDIGTLTILPAGTVHRHATELLASNRMRALVKETVGRYDNRIVIFDSPPLLGASEASALANHMGQVVVVVEAGKTPQRALKHALDRIDESKIAGLVLNKGTSFRRGYGYGAYG